MKSKNTPVTLPAIGELIDQKLVPVFNELGALKQQISDVDNNLGTKINFVNTKLEEFRKETKTNFVGVYDGMSSLANTLDQDLEPRIKNLETRQLFA